MALTIQERLKDLRVEPFLPLAWMKSETIRRKRWLQMMGAIVGDIVGSVYEWHNIKTKDFPLFRDNCFFTDDTVMTCAVAQAVMEGGQRDAFIDAMKKYGWLYPGAGPVWRMAVFREPGAVLQLWQRRGHAGLPLRLGDRLRFRGGVGQVVAQGPRPCAGVRRSDP